MPIRRFLGPSPSPTTAAVLLLLALGMTNTVSSSMASTITLGDGARDGILRPVRSLFYDTQQLDDEDQIEPADTEKRSMAMGRLSFRPGKRWNLPVTGAYAHDRQNRRYNLLLIGADRQQQQPFELAPSAEMEYNVPIQAQPNMVRHVNFRLLPTEGTPADKRNIGDFDVQEAGMGKRTAAMGRVGFRPGKRSMAVGRTGFRPGKRSIATGRVGFRPGKRSSGGYFVTLGDAGQSLLL